MRITEDYVSFETAKLLKKKGFKVETEHELWYVVKEFSTGCHWNSCTYKVGETTREYDKKYCISMPTLQMAMKWLREMYSLMVVVHPSYPIDGIKYESLIYRLTELKDASVDEYNYNNEEYNNYEEACEAAIRYCLENLI